jgi:GNAT superfamily N-acetyltransferase
MNSTSGTSTQIMLRPIRPGDVVQCGQILFDAFAAIAAKHNFPRDFAAPEMGAGLLSALVEDPQVHGVVAERDGVVVGSNFLFEHDEIGGVGPITVDPAAQAQGIGRALMEAVIERGRRRPGIRLVQDAFNGASLSLYASLGFDAREPLALMSGIAFGGPPAGDVEVRAMREEDLIACAELCRSVHGIDRTNELREAMAQFSPMVLLRRGRVRAYASAPYMWLMNHGVAETEQDMRALLLGAAAGGAPPISLLMPVRQGDLLRWCLSAGLRVVKPMTLMSLGRYQEPRGCFHPSVLY